MNDQHGERFARLQRRLATATAAMSGASRRSVVVLPTRSVDRWHEPTAETRSYQERLLSFVLDLHDPALELNLRLGGTTHPYQTLARLTGGSYDPQTASFTTRRGYPRHYVATDHLEIPQLPMLGQAGLLARATRENLRFDHDRGRGVVFHMPSSIDSLATVGVTAIADAPHRADHLYAHVLTVLARAGGKLGLRGGPGPVRAALATEG